MDDLQKRIAACCKKLRLSSTLAERAMTQEGDTNQEYLYNLLCAEVECRRQTRLTKYMNAAGFPRRYTKEQYHTGEVDFPEGVSFESLLQLDFYHAGKNVIMYGGTGTGKTMLSILIGMAALINQFSEAKQKGTLTQFIKKLSAAQILILDEFGYVPYDRAGSELLFDYLSSIHEQKPVILNTNIEFSQWVNVLYDARMTTALIGRLTHHVELILFPGGNNRIRESSMNERMIRSSQSGEA